MEIVTRPLQFFLWVSLGATAATLLTSSCGAPELIAANEPLSSRDEPREIRGLDREAFPEAPPRYVGPPPRVTTIADARRAIEHGRYQSALHFLKGRSDSLSRFLLARVLHATGRYRLAGAHARAVSSDDTLRVDAALLLAELELDSGHRAEAEQRLRQLVSDHPGLPRVALSLGRLLVEMGRRDEAFAIVSPRCLGGEQGAGGQQDADRHMCCALAAEARWQLEEARVAWSAAVDVAPSDVGALLGLAHAIGMVSGYVADGERIREALAVNPNSPDVLAAAAKRFGCWSPAAAYADRALEINPNHVDALLELIRFAICGEDFAKAERLLDRVEQIDRSNSAALSWRAALSWVNTGEFRSLEERILALDPNNGDLFRNVASAVPPSPRRIPLYENAVRVEPDDPLNWVALGFSSLHWGERDRGLSALHEALQRNPRHERVAEVLALHHEVLEHFYETVRTPHAEVLFHRTERPLLERYLPQIVESAYARTAERFRFQPRSPLRVYFVRSPYHLGHGWSRPNGLENSVSYGSDVFVASHSNAGLERLLLREFSLLFAREMSGHRAPYWFYHGLWAHEGVGEWYHEPWRDERLKTWLKSDELPPLGKLHRWFQRGWSSTRGDYISFRAVSYVVDRFGFDKVTEMLRAWGRGLNTDMVIDHVLRTTAEELRESFLSSEHQRLNAPTGPRPPTGSFPDEGRVWRARQDVEQAPLDVDAQGALALCLVAFTRTQREEGRRIAEQIVQQDPEHALARYALAFFAPVDGRDYRISPLDRDPSALESEVVRRLWDNADRWRGNEDFAKELEQWVAATVFDPEHWATWQTVVASAENERDRRHLAFRHFGGPRPGSRPSEHWEFYVGVLARGDRWSEILARRDEVLAAGLFYGEPHRVLAEAYARLERYREAAYEFSSATLAFGLETEAYAQQLETGRSVDELIWERTTRYYGRANARRLLGRAREGIRRARSGHERVSTFVDAEEPGDSVRRASDR